LQRFQSIVLRRGWKIEAANKIVARKGGGWKGEGGKEERETLGEWVLGLSLFFPHMPSIFSIFYVFVRNQIKVETFFNCFCFLC
jgi:hypothetical protein